MTDPVLDILAQLKGVRWIAYFLAGILIIIGAANLNPGAAAQARSVRQMPALLVLGFVVLILGALWLHARSNTRLAQRHMAAHEPLTPSDFGQRYFSPAQAPIATRLRELLATETAVDLDRLHPDDQPVHDLRIDELDSLALTEFVMAIEKEFGIDLPDSDVARIRTFRELVQLVSREVENAGTA